MNSALTIHLSPLLPEAMLYGIGFVMAALLVLSIFVYRQGLLWRTICAAGFLLVLMNPSLIEEDRKAATDIVAVVVDQSPSQQNGVRTQRTEQALAYIEDTLKQLPDLDVRTIKAPQEKDGLANETHLFEPLDRIFADVPVNRRSGTIFITDGQIHDVPENIESLDSYGPVHALLTGKKDERDRQLIITEAPAYGIVGQKVTIRYRVKDTENINQEFATVISRVNDESPSMNLIPVGEEQSLEVTINHAGQNIVDLQVSPADDEITMANNRTPLIINGVRDRLRVLLVSGQPHAGGRTWRNLLTADPGVDLVHFTILREPNKLDATPQNELSLIAFPFRELFEVKLYDFDLIIFDRYRLNRILPNYYFANIANYVKQGGALLEASGPSFAGEDSVYTTALKDVLPAYPTGAIYNRSYMPEITDLGMRHPVTEDLRWNISNEDSPQWGQWLRQIAVHPMSGNVLMSGVDKSPLLILDRIGKGRVAQLASDQIWLWSRGFEGGGPQTDLLRRLAHWLMKEPELEENALEINTRGDEITVMRRALKDIPLTATMTTPEGNSKALELQPDGNGYLKATVKADELGIYTVDDGMQKRFAIIGELNPPELSGVITTDEKLRPLTTKSKGSIHWLEDNNEPNIRMLPDGRDYGGKNWLGLRKNRSYTVTGVKDRPFMPSWVYALALLSLCIATWWFEGRTKA